jgi:hypothetical protein
MERNRQGSDADSAGIGENLFWELKQAVETLNPQKMLILFPNMKRKHYESFCTNVKPVLRVSLQEAPTLSRRFGRVEGFIAFAPDWKPSFSPVRSPYFRRAMLHALSVILQVRAKTRFESLGLEWQPLPVRVEKILIPLARILWVGLTTFIVLIRH